MSRVVRKPSMVQHKPSCTVSTEDYKRLEILDLEKPSCTSTEDYKRLEILDLESRGIVLSI